MSLREKFIFLSRKIGITLFFLMFIYVGAIKIFGKETFPPQYLIFIFFSCFLFLILTLIPPQISRDFFWEWIFFLSLFFIIIGTSIGVIPIYVFHINISDLFKRILQIVILSSFFGFFVSLVKVGNNDNRKDREIRESIIDAFINISQKLNLNFEDESSEDAVKLLANGNYNSNHIQLFVIREFYINKGVIISFRGGNRKRNLVSESSIFFKTNFDFGKIHIESFHGALKINGLSSELEEYIRTFINEKMLNYFDFSLYSYPVSELENSLLMNLLKKTPLKNYTDDSYKNFKWIIELRISVAIEEENLWLDYIKLIEELIKKYTTI
jgi:hypothetical protein